MKIKNKARLVARAERHLAEDRFIYWAFIEEDVGHLFKGCAIGCLAMPTDPRRIAGKLPVSLGGQRHLLASRIKAEFGICGALLDAAEELFMSIEPETNRVLGGWTVRFAKALPAGQDVTDAQVHEWLRAQPDWHLLSDGPIAQDKVKAAMTAFCRWLRAGCPAPREANITA